ncbi:MAG: MraZ family transcriptional regulator [Acidobacteria bacterium RIFCSPLOWO2_12_FULL_54_10]|nr:MAG: MraZ family transcriptional regulator [Acidobacteria bacterium RIFCSPLOWO2_12_FULL_54_10]
MLRGNYPARVDEKGRLKIPAPFKQEIEKSYGSQFCITSHDGQFARIYPFEEWIKIEEKLAHNPSFNKTRRKFLDRTNYYGQIVQWDNQGRVLIPAVLRESAEMKGEVAVLGNLTYLTVWNNQRFLEEIRNNPITSEDERILDELGI